MEQKKNAMFSKSVKEFYNYLFPQRVMTTKQFLLAQKLMMINKK